MTKSLFCLVLDVAKGKFGLILPAEEVVWFFALRPDVFCNVYNTLSVVLSPSGKAAGA